jgi:hypothetical protein
MEHTRPIRRQGHPPLTPESRRATRTQDADDYSADSIKVLEGLKLLDAQHVIGRLGRWTASSRLQSSTTRSTGAGWLLRSDQRHDSIDSSVTVIDNSRIPVDRHTSGKSAAEWC